MQKLDGPFIAPASGTVKNLVILLHGYGDSGHGLISLGEEMAPALPDTAFVAPHAVEICEAWTQGYQWFPIRNAEASVIVKEISRRETIKPPSDILSHFIDEQLEKWGVDESRLVVGGFSQGAMMAMYTMPRRKRPCAGVIGYSGMLIDPEGLKSPDIVKMPMLVIHGAEDTVVPPQCLSMAEAGLKAAGFDVETMMRPYLGHSIDQEGFMKGVDFIRRVLK